tara:strand:+ start:243 stop:602 length:360 start_codon:yes stop_codon:yes gene_type:complete
MSRNKLNTTEEPAQPQAGLVAGMSVTTGLPSIQPTPGQPGMPSIQLSLFWALVVFGILSAIFFMSSVGMCKWTHLDSETGGMLLIVYYLKHMCNAIFLGIPGVFAFIFGKPICKLCKGE